MTENDNILQKLQFLAGIHPNDLVFGGIVRSIVEAPENNPKRTCEIDDEDCLNCGS